MGKDVYIKQRNKPSMFDPYAEDIRNLIYMGYGFDEVREMLSVKMGRDVKRGSLVYWCYDKGLNVTRYGSIPDSYECENCKYHQIIENENGKTTYRLCTKSWKIIRKRIKYLPEFCEEHENRNGRMVIN